jgi:hypothetical protein
MLLETSKTKGYRKTRSTILYGCAIEEKPVKACVCLVLFLGVGGAGGAVFEMLVELIIHVTGGKLRVWNPNMRHGWFPDLLTFSSTTMLLPFNGCISAQMFAHYIASLPYMDTCKHARAWRTQEGVRTFLPATEAYSHQVAPGVFAHFEYASKDAQDPSSLLLSTWSTQKGEDAMKAFTKNCLTWYTKTYGTTLFFTLNAQGVRPLGARKVVSASDRMKLPPRSPVLLTRFSRRANNRRRLACDGRRACFSRVQRARAKMPCSRRLPKSTTCVSLQSIPMA